MSAYKQALTDAMTTLASDPLVRFVGYGLLHGRAGGTMTGVPDAQIIEMPTAENLMAGVAIGLALKGYKPLLYFERADFLLNAADALVNHLQAMKELSGGEFAPACIIRVTTGNQTKPLFTGPVHTQDLTEAMRKLLSFRVVALARAKVRVQAPGIREEDPIWPAQIASEYEQAHERLGVESTMLIEYKDLW